MSAWTYDDVSDCIGMFSRPRLISNRFIHRQEDRRPMVLLGGLVWVPGGEKDPNQEL